MNDKLQMPEEGVTRVSSNRFIINKVDGTGSNEKTNETNLEIYIAPANDKSDKEILISPSRQVKFNTDADPQEDNNNTNTATNYKSFGRMSITERLPNIAYYRNMDTTTGSSANRPTLEELHKPSDANLEAKLVSIIGHL